MTSKINLRYCTVCGQILDTQQLKNGDCKTCGVKMPYHHRWNKLDGWGTCEHCFAYHHKTFSFCSICGHHNPVAMANKIKSDIQVKQSMAKRIKTLANEVKSLKSSIPTTSQSEDLDIEVKSIFSQESSSSQTTKPEVETVRQVTTPSELELGDIKKPSECNNKVSTETPPSDKDSIQSTDIDESD